MTRTPREKMVKIVEGLYWLFGVDRGDALPAQSREPLRRLSTKLAWHLLEALGRDGPIPSARAVVVRHGPYACPDGGGGTWDRRQDGHVDARGRRLPGASSPSA